MARETSIKTNAGLTLYRVVRRQSDGFYWNGSDFEAFNLADWTTGAGGYLAELTRTTLVADVVAEYAIDFPAAIAAGRYRVEVYRRAGTSPALADDGLPVWEQVIDWSGSAERTLAGVVVADYAAGKDPASLLLTAPANKIKTNANNQVETSNPTAGPSAVKVDMTEVRGG